MRHCISLMTLILLIAAGLLPVTVLLPTPNSHWKILCPFNNRRGQKREVFRHTIQENRASPIKIHTPMSRIFDYDDDPFAEPKVTIADPLEPFNRISYQFRQVVLLGSQAGRNRLQMDCSRTSTDQRKTILFQRKIPYPFHQLPFTGRFQRCRH